MAGICGYLTAKTLTLGVWRLGCRPNAGLMLGRRYLPAVRRSVESYALRHPLERTTIELGRLGPDAVTVGAATLPLADFLSRGGRTPESAPAVR